MLTVHTSDARWFPLCYHELSCKLSWKFVDIYRFLCNRPSMFSAIWRIFLRAKAREKVSGPSKRRRIHADSDRMDLLLRIFRVSSEKTSFTFSPQDEWKEEERNNKELSDDKEQKLASSHFQVVDHLIYNIMRNYPARWAAPRQL